MHHPVQLIAHKQYINPFGKCQRIFRRYSSEQITDNKLTAEAIKIDSEAFVRALSADSECLEDMFFHLRSCLFFSPFRAVFRCIFSSGLKEWRLFRAAPQKNTAENTAVATLCGFLFWRLFLELETKTAPYFGFLLQT